MSDTGYELEDSEGMGVAISAMPDGFPADGIILVVKWEGCELCFMEVRDGARQRRVVSLP